MNIVGPIAGILLAGFMSAMRPEGSSFEWLAVVGGVAVLCLLIALASAAVALFRNFLVLRFGEPSQWTRRGVLHGICFFAFASSLIYLSVSGTLAAWLRVLTDSVQRLQLSGEISIWVGGLLMLACIVFMLRNAVSWVRSSTVTISDRLWGVTAVGLLLWLLTLFIIFLIHIPFATVNAVTIGGGWVLLGTALLASLAWCVEWILKYHDVKRAGWTVQTKGFHWWVLVTWVAIGLVITATSAIGDHLRHAADGLALYQLGQLAYGILCVVWMLAFYPGLVVTLLYMRRVSRAHRALLFRMAQPHPDRAQHWSDQSAAGDEQVLYE